jgi:hypothetical protein
MPDSSISAGSSPPTRAPSVGDIFVFTGSGWATLSPEGVVGASAELKPSPGPLFPLRDREEQREVELQELLEILLCEDCDMELGATPCSARHAYLADHPMEHRLLLPRLAEYKDEIRRNRDGTCALCKVPIATGDCDHVRVANGQVVMSEATWRKQVDELLAAGALKAAKDEEEGR